MVGKIKLFYTVFKKFTRKNYFFFFKNTKSYCSKIYKRLHKVTKFILKKIKQLINLVKSQIFKYHMFNILFYTLRFIIQGLIVIIICLFIDIDFFIFTKHLELLIWTDIPPISTVTIYSLSPGKPYQYMILITFFSNFCLTYISKSILYFSKKIYKIKSKYLQKSVDANAVFFFSIFCAKNPLTYLKLYINYCSNEIKKFINSIPEKKQKLVEKLMQKSQKLITKIKNIVEFLKNPIENIKNYIEMKKIEMERKKIEMERKKKIRDRWGKVVIILADRKREKKRQEKIEKKMRPIREKREHLQRMEAMYKRIKEETDEFNRQNGRM